MDKRTEREVPRKVASGIPAARTNMGRREVSEFFRRLEYPCGFLHRAYEHNRLVRCIIFKRKCRAAGMTSPRFESRFKAISFIFFKRMAAASFFSSVLKTLCPRGKIAIGGLGWLAFFSCGAATLLDDTFADGTLNNVQATNAGTYSVVVNNLAGSATSSNAVLTLNTNAIAPSFVTSPASIITLVGGAVSFSAAASGTAPIYYQWQKNSSPLAGATGNTLNLTNVQNADAGSYSLIVSNNVGTATSSAATLTITT